MFEADRCICPILYMDMSQNARDDSPPFAHETPPTMSTVFLVDDDPMLVELLSDAVSEMHLPSRHFASGEQFLAAVGRDTSGCVILDIVLPGMSGLDVLDALRLCGSDLPVVAISGHASVRVAVHAMRAGALTVFEKPFAVQDVEAAIRDALKVERERLPRRKLRQDAASRFAALTDAERNVLELLLQGLANKVVAARLRFSQRTVERHRSAALKKLGVDTLIAAGAICARLQRMPPPAALVPRRVA